VRERCVKMARQRTSSHFQSKILVVSEGMGVLGERENHAEATLVTLGKQVAFSHNSIMRQAVLVMNHPVEAGLWNWLAGAVDLVTEAEGGFPWGKMFNHVAVR